MKTFFKFCLITIYLSISGDLFSQNFISENKVWSIVTKGGMEQSWIRTSSFKFSGDTTMQKVHYKKLLKSEDEQKKNWLLNSLWFERNDSIFQYSPETDKNLLVYNFNIAEKDSFLNPFNGFYLYVDSIRTKEWGIGERELIYFHSKENSYLHTVWIRGVGQNGLITRSSEAGITGGSSSILCFEENGQQVYQNLDYNSCYISESLFTEDMLWSTMTGSGGDCGNYYCWNYYTKVAGDTIIDEKQYKRVLNSNDSLMNHWSVVGYIREVGQKIFYRRMNTETDCLLYNFGCMVGDTLNLNCWCTDKESEFKVDSINYLPVMGKNRKHIYLSYLNNSSTELWIEGIGSIGGVLNGGGSNNCITGGSESLLCCSKSGVELYHDYEYNNCYLNSGIITKKVIEPNKKWMYAIGQEYPTPIINRYDCLTIGEDTVISNKEYYKLYNLYNCEYENSNLRGFTRETEDAKVYFLPENEKQEWLLYDFGLNIGDSIYTDWNDSYLYMDSIVTDETNKKIYYVRFQNQSIQWIEEVGSNIGLLMERITGGLRIFTCCFRNEELVYRLPEYSSCDITLSNEVNKMPVPFNLYPNPASEKINIEINKSPTNTLTGEIIAIDGTIIKSFKIDNKPNYILDVHLLNPGLYFIQICLGAETYTKKVIIK